jgi:hypothetical protein
VQLLEALALSLTGGDGATRLGDRHPFLAGYPVVPHPLCHQPEHATLHRGELGQELGDQQTVLASERDLLGALLVATGRREGVDRSGILGEDLLTRALVAVQVQRALPDAAIQRPAEVLFVSVGAV